MLFALPVGVLSATRPYSIFDQIANTLAFIGFSLPTFFTGLLFILLFSINLDWLPFVYRSRPRRHRLALVLGGVQAGDDAGHGAGPVPGRRWTRYVRSAVLDVIRLDYVTTARSKGLASASSF